MISKFKQADFYRRMRKGVEKSRIYYYLNIAGYYARTKIANLLNRDDFDNVDTFCLFAGHGRSGHSMIGALLDAHPNAILSDETDILKYLGASFDQKQLYRTLIFCSFLDKLIHFIGVQPYEDYIEACTSFVLVPLKNTHHLGQRYDHGC